MSESNGNGYEQAKLDLTLDIDRDLKDNMQTMTEFALNQIEHSQPDPVKNAHEGYGIVAENYAALLQMLKAIKKDMDTMLKLLSEGDSATLNIVGGLYNSALQTAVEAVKLAAQSQRILGDLYYGEEKTPIEEYLEAVEGENDGFEEADSVTEDAETEDE